MGPNLSVNNNNQNLTFSEILDKTLINTIMNDLDPDTAATDLELRDKICKKLSETGVPKNLTDKLMTHLGSKSLRTTHNTSNNLHLLKGLGIPSREVFEFLTRGQEFVGHTNTKIRNTISIDMSPKYLSLIFQEIPGATESIRDSHFTHLLQTFMRTSLPPPLDKNKRLHQIYTYAHENARTYVQLHETTKARSVAAFSMKEEGTFPTLRYTETEIKKFQKKLTSEETPDLTTLDENLSYQCFHCKADATMTTADHLTSENSSMDPDFAQCNILRLQVLRTTEEIERHYTQVHNKPRKSHKFLIPCIKCISDKNMATAFACCLNCLRTHYLHIHAGQDHVHTIASELETTFKRDPHMTDLVKQLFDIRCRICYRYT